MRVLYKKPGVMSYSACDIVEKLGPCQNQYTTTILHTTTGNSSRNVDGYIDSEGDITYNASNKVGDQPDNTFMYILVGFDISGIHSTVVSATLRLYQLSVGGSPYTNLGNLVADHVDFGTSIDGADFTGGTLTSNIGEISTSATLGWKTMDVTTYVQRDLDRGVTSSQFRLRFTKNTDSDGDVDLSDFESAENFGGTKSYPQLVVTYKD